LTGGLVSQFLEYLSLLLFNVMVEHFLQDFRERLPRIGRRKVGLA
jgi:hypothetical protein